MIFESLSINNFLTIGNIQCSLSNKGLVLIQGENKDDSSQDSNGSGKSSFPDAISWCLFGTTARGESGDRVINRKERKNCVVSIVLKDDEASYTVTRHRKHGKHKNRLIVEREENGSITDLTKGTDKLTQELVNKIVGCSEDVFNSAIYAGQEAMPDLPGMSDKNLKLLVEEAAGIDRLQEAHAKAQAKLRQTKADFTDVNSELSDVKTKAAQLKDMVQDLQDKQVEHERSRQQSILDLKGEIELKEKTVESVKEKVEKATDALAKIEKASAQIKASLNAVNEETERRDELATNLNDLKNEVKFKERDLLKALNELKAKVQATESVDNLVGTACGECHKTYSEEDLDDARQAAEKRRKTAALEAREAKQSLELSRAQLETARETLSAFESQMTDVSDQVAKQADLDAKAVRYRAVIDCEQTHTEALNNLKQRREELENEGNPFDELIAKNKAQLKKLADDLKAALKAVKQSEEQVKIASAAEKVFGPAGVRAHILDTVTPYLNHRTAEYLGTLTDENITAQWSTLSTTAAGDLREKFAIEVSSKVGAANFKGLSGGEKRKVRLACSMALQDLVSSRASKPIELFIADEIDHALDEAGLERLMQILNDKARAKGTALVISHNSLSDWINQSVSIIKEDGLSRMEGIL